MKLLPMLESPGLGEPCNHCGHCCRVEVCGLGLEAFGDVAAPCPAIRVRDGKSFCAVVEEAAKLDVSFGGWYAWRLGFGRGCDVELESAR